MKEFISRSIAGLLAAILVFGSTAAAVSSERRNADADSAFRIQENAVIPFSAVASSGTINKYGNLILTADGKTAEETLSSFTGAGYAITDIVTVQLGSTSMDLPVCSTFTDVDNGDAGIFLKNDMIMFAINAGDFATDKGIATKTDADDGTFSWKMNPGIPDPLPITITMKTKGGYADGYKLHHISYDRADYPKLTDEQFANFRVISTKGMGKNVLYRFSSPIDPQEGRSTYADAAIRKAGVDVIMNLANDEASVVSFPGYAQTYYSGVKHIALNEEFDITGDEFRTKLAPGLRFFVENIGTYGVHCLEGKDRAGFVSAILECLMGAACEEIQKDYMISYFNYFGLKEGDEQYPVKAEIITGELEAVFGVDDLEKADLAKEAREYIRECGLTDEEVETLITNLSGSKPNSMSVKGKTVTVNSSKRKKKKLTIPQDRILSIKKAKGTLRFEKLGGSKAISLNKSTGNLIMGKGVKKGNYKIKLRIYDSGDGVYRRGAAETTVRIRIR
ncbi:MAG: tyrosine-protein phosphatase [Eubacterium sp.]|nr:tyrosine-protein phosphatase [Eubacterium sp.]